MRSNAIMHPKTLSTWAALALATAIAGAACSSAPSGPVLPNVVATHDLDAGVHLAGIAIGKHGDVWLSTINYGNGPSGIIHVLASGDAQRIERPESFNRVAVDPSGVAWFTVGAGASHARPKLVRVDPSGRVRDFALPTEGDYEGIAIGPDGVPWFTDTATGAIGRIAANDAITYYGPASGGPAEIASGSDGRLWFTETNGNSIGRLATDGTLDEFTVPTALSRPTGIASGAAGSLWFCEAAADKIGRIAENGKIAEFRVPTAGAWPTSIARARDGSMWFTELMTAKVARISRTGSVAEYAVPGGGYPGPIAAAPDGSMWVAVNANSSASFGPTSSRSRLVRFTPQS
jgi:virginiamycin B lyase